MATGRARSGMLGAMLLTGVDQGVLSALNLAIALAFIRYASKAEFGVYTLVNGLVLLALGVQTALVVTPLTANGARLVGVARASFVGAVFRLQCALGAAMALLLALGVHGYEAAHGVGSRHGPLALGAGIAVAGGWMREFYRSVEFLDHRSDRALVGDLCFVAGAALALVAVRVCTGCVRASSVLCAVGGAALLPGLIGFLREGRARCTARDCRDAARVLVDQGRWTLPGMGVSWGQNTGYAYVVALLLGSAAVGELAAARLFVMPLNLLMQAWSRTFLPRAGALLGRGRDVYALCRRSAGWLLAGSLLYLAAVCTFLALGGTRLLPSKYAGLGLLVVVWGGFAVVNVVRNVASNALLAHTAFRALFVYSVAAATGSITLVVALVRGVGTAGAVGGLIGGELLLAGLCWRALRRQRGATTMSSAVVSPGR